MTSMKLLHVSCLGYYPQGVFWDEGMEVLTGMIVNFMYCGLLIC